VFSLVSPVFLAVFSSAFFLQHLFFISYSIFQQHIPLYFPQQYQRTCVKLSSAS